MALIRKRRLTDQQTRRIEAQQVRRVDADAEDGELREGLIIVHFWSPVAGQRVDR